MNVKGRPTNERLNHSQSMNKLDSKASDLHYQDVRIMIGDTYSDVNLDKNIVRSNTKSRKIRNILS
jgi:hypothetical protein